VITTPDETAILNALANRYAAPAWAFFTHVRNAAGFSANRTADGFAMGLWPSRGLELHGFEVKVARADWLRELRDPLKVEQSLFRYCDRWWVVTPPDVAKVDEIPPTWGLLVLKGNRCVTAKEAPKLDCQPVTRSFLAVLLRRLHEAEMHPAETRAAYEKGVAAEQERQEQMRESTASRHAELLQRIDEFEKASGVHFEGWNAGRIGEAVKMVLEGRHRDALRQAGYIRHQLARVLERLDEALKEGEP